MNGWQMSNGWSLLRERIGRLSGILPFQVVVGPVALAASPDGDTRVTGRASQLLDSDGELYIFSTAAVGYDPTLPDNGCQLGYASDAWPDYWDATVVVGLENLSGLRLTDQPAHVGTVFGGARTNPIGSAAYNSRSYEYVPRYLAAPWIISPGATITVEVAHRYTQAQTVWFVFNGYKRMLDTPSFPVDPFLSPQLLGTLERYRREGALCRVEPFFYTLAYDELDRAPSGTEQRSLVVADADFAVCDQTCAVLDPEQAKIFGGQSGFFRSFLEQCQLTLNDGDVRLFDRAAPLGNFFGTGREPFYLPSPLLMGAGMNLTSLITFGDFTDTVNEALRAYLGFHGVRIWTQ